MDNPYGTPQPEGQQKDYRSQPFYQLPYPNLLQESQGHAYSQQPYGQETYGQPPHGQYNAPPQPSSGAPSSSPPGYGYSAPPQQQYPGGPGHSPYQSSHSTLFQPPRSDSSYQNQGAYPPPSGQVNFKYPPPSHSPYQHSAGYPARTPPGYLPTAAPQTQGAASSYLNHYPAGSQYPPPGSAPPGGIRPEDDRGFMGALAGGTAGAMAGHKVNHGLLGALGGAFAGHKLQGAVSDHKKHNKPGHKHSRSSSSSSSSSSDNSHARPRPQQQCSQQQPHQQQQHAPRYAGNFSLSASQISLDGDYDLIASCKRVDGSGKLSSISLNRELTNDDGHFRWSKEGNFGATARNVRLVDNGRALEAELQKDGGHWVWSKVVLDEKIGNSDGELVLV